MAICPICKSTLNHTHAIDDPAWIDDPIPTALGLSGAAYIGDAGVRWQHIKQLQIYYTQVATDMSVTLPTWIAVANGQPVTKRHIEQLRIAIETLLTEAGLTLEDYFDGDKYGETYTSSQTEWTDCYRVSGYPAVASEGPVRAICVEELRRGFLKPEGLWWWTDHLASTIITPESSSVAIETFGGSGEYDEYFLSSLPQTFTVEYTSTIENKRIDTYVVGDVPNENVSANNIWVGNAYGPYGSTRSNPLVAVREVTITDTAIAMFDTRVIKEISYPGSLHTGSYQKWVWTSGAWDVVETGTWSFESPTTYALTYVSESLLSQNLEFVNDLPIKDPVESKSYNVTLQAGFEGTVDLSITSVLPLHGTVVHWEEDSVHVPAQEGDYLWYGGKFSSLEDIVCGQRVTTVTKFAGMVLVVRWESGSGVMRYTALCFGKFSGLDVLTPIQLADFLGLEYTAVLTMHLIDTSDFSTIDVTGTFISAITAEEFAMATFAQVNTIRAVVRYKEEAVDNITEDVDYYTTTSVGDQTRETALWLDLVKFTRTERI